jgi:hypothetical protein
MISFKDNNIYYYNYKIFNGELSFVLFFILLFIILFKKDWLTYIAYACVFVFVYGTIESILRYKKYK